MLEFLKGYSALEKFGLVLLAAICGHVLVRLVRWASSRLMSTGTSRKMRKTRTVASLTTSALIFTLYLLVLGYAFYQFDVPLTGYVAGVSVIGIAVAFGSQGLVQDIVTGLTVIVTDLFDVDDMVEIGGQIGIVRKVGIRFTVLQNALGAEVFLQNRSIANVITYPRAYIRCNVDITLSRDAVLHEQERSLVQTLTDALVQQFPRIHRASPEILGTEATATGRSYVRIKFRIWPGRGGPIETSFKQEIVAALKELDTSYADWMVAVNYEVERDPRLDGPTGLAGAAAR